MNRRIQESDASWARAKRRAKRLEKLGKGWEADNTTNKAFKQEVVRRHQNPETRTKRVGNLYRDIETPSTNGQGSFLKMVQRSKAVQESVFNTYRNLAIALLEGRWNTRHLSPEDRADRASSDTSHEAPFDKRGKKHVKRREKRLAKRSALARRAAAESKAADDEADARDVSADMRRGGSRY